MSTDRNDLRIGLWGGTQSGKTSFLAALALASLRSSNRYGRWTIIGEDDVSDDFLIEHTDMLERRHFPQATPGPTPYSWSVRGDLGGSALERLSRSLFGDRNVVEFKLEVIDVPGRLLAPGTSASDPDLAAVLDHFVRCDGLVYLHDPLHSLADPDHDANFGYVHAPLNRIARRASAAGKFENGNLKHRLAVCVGKFDDPRVFEPAWRQGLIVQDQPPPRIPRPANPKQYFERMSGDLVTSALQNFFHPQRVDYFATSAIGFRLGADGLVHLEDYANVRLIDDVPQIIGPVRPINVLEPLIMLERKLRFAR